MSSEGSNVVINSVNPGVQINSNTVNGVQPDDGLFKELEQNSTEKKGEKDTAPQQSTTSPPEMQQEEEEEKTVSATLKETEEKLKTRGFVDPVLVQYYDETPELFDKFVELYEAVTAIRQSLHVTEDFVYIPDNLKTVFSFATSEKTTVNDKTKLGNLLAALGFSEVCRDLYDKLVATFPKILSYDQEEDQNNRDNETLQEAQNCMENLCSVLIKYTDRSDDFCVAVSEAGLISRLLDMIENMKDCIPCHARFMDKMGVLSHKTTRGLILSSVLCTVYNMSKRVQTRATFAQCNAVQILLPLIDNKVLEFAAAALLTLAYLTDDSNNEQIMANEGLLIRLIYGLQFAITCSPDHTFIEYTSEELAEGLAHIAVNDDNKKTIAAYAIPLSKQMILNAKRDEERIGAIKLLWVLAFDEGNKEKIRQTKGLVTLLKYWKEYGKHSIQKAAHGALWEIEGKQGLESSKDVKRVGTGNKQHVMISYEWDVLETAIQVKIKLQNAGFKVWMDLEQIGGYKLDDMATAVENSAVVLVCVSQKYEESVDCRAEAEHAFKLKKDIVPLMMQSNYKADGWLGMAIGASKLCFDFSQGQKEIDNNFKLLVKELGSRGKVKSEDSAIEDEKRVVTRNKKHVMISYQWDVQKTIIQVKNKLQSAGFNVWLDLENMSGSTDDTMANAVENSAVVLVCYSHKYKESSNCRSEAKYADELKKDIIPLKMQSNYKADGWLGLLLAKRFWYDFSPGQKSIDKTVEALVEALGSRGKIDSKDSAMEAINVDTVDAVPDRAQKIYISDWTSEDVMEWLQTFEMEVKRKHALPELNGFMLMQLHNLRSECPGFYYSSLKEDFGLDDVCSVLKFTHELEKLI